MQANHTTKTTQASKCGDLRRNESCFSRHRYLLGSCTNLFSYQETCEVRRKPRLTRPANPTKASEGEDTLYSFPTRQVHILGKCTEICAHPLVSYIVAANMRVGNDLFIVLACRGSIYVHSRIELNIITPISASPTPRNMDSPYSPRGSLPCRMCLCCISGMAALLSFGIRDRGLQ